MAAFPVIVVFGINKPQKAFLQKIVFCELKGEFSFVNTGGKFRFKASSNTGHTYSWDFGDGKTGKGIDPYHEYAKAGTYTVYINAYDAGTEANDEIINGGGMSGVAGIPAAPGGNGGANGTGVMDGADNMYVHTHPGVLGDTDPAGGPSDLDSRIHRWLNPVAKVVVTVKQEVKHENHRH